jgi:serine/threonine protein kinase
LKSCTTIDSKKYLILGHLGDGRQGDVYAAYHKQVNVRRAIKIIPGRQDCGEAAAIGLLEHSPHRSIAKIIDFDNHTVTINGEPVNAVTLEYIEGQNLEEFISHQTSSRRGDAEGVAVQIAGQLVDAVEHLLKQGIRHRDIRPANIKLMAGTTSSNLDVKLIDFGASTDGLDDGEKDNTRFGGQSDLNSIGQIIYHFCSRQNIFNATGKPDADVKQDIKEYRTSLIGRGEVRRLNPLLRRNIREWPLRQFIRDCLSATGKIEDDLALIKTLRSDLKSTQKFIKWRRDRPRRLKELGVICLASVTLAGGYHVASELFPHKETQQMVRQSSSERLQKDITSSYKSPDFIREKMLKDAERNYADLTIEDRRKLYREMIDIERALGSYDKVAEYYTKMISITTGKMEKLTLIGSRAELYDKYLKDAKRALADYEQALSLLPEAAAETHKGFDRENEKIRRYLEDKVELFRTINSMISAPARH